MYFKEGEIISLNKFAGHKLEKCLVVGIGIPEWLWFFLPFTRGDYRYEN